MKIVVLHTEVVVAYDELVGKRKFTPKFLSQETQGVSRHIMLRLVTVHADLFAVDERKEILLELGDGVDLAVHVVKDSSTAG